MTKELLLNIDKNNCVFLLLYSLHTKRVMLCFAFEWIKLIAALISYCCDDLRYIVDFCWTYHSEKDLQSPRHLYRRTQTLHRWGHWGWSVTGVWLLETVGEDDCSGGIAETVETTGTPRSPIQSEQSCEFRTPPPRSIQLVSSNLHQFSLRFLKRYNDFIEQE